MGDYNVPKTWKTPSGLDLSSDVRYKFSLLEKLFQVSRHPVMVKLQSIGD